MEKAQKKLTVVSQLKWYHMQIGGVVPPIVMFFHGLHCLVSATLFQIVALCYHEEQPENPTMHVHCGEQACQEQEKVLHLDEGQQPHKRLAIINYYNSIQNIPTVGQVVCSYNP